MKENISRESLMEAKEYIEGKIDFKPEIALVLGSSLGALADEVENQVRISYKDIPNFLQSTVEGHKGELILGQLHGKNVVFMSGRFHYYEGYDFEQLVIPVRVFKLLGVESIILTNAAGSINENFKVGDIMLITDHIKLMGDSPLRGMNDDYFGPRFPDMTNVYVDEYQELAREVAKDVNLDLKEGVYFYFEGPQFETPAEIKLARILGGDAAGMSTVTEAIPAAHCGMKVLAMSLITNMAAGMTGEKLSHEEVKIIGEQSSAKFRKLIGEIIRKM